MKKGTKFRHYFDLLMEFIDLQTFNLARFSSIEYDFVLKVS